MKNILLTILATILPISAATASGGVSYGAIEVKESVLFPNFGNVSADQVCIDGETLRASVPAHRINVCTREGTVTDLSGYPVKGCIESHEEIVPEQNLERSLTIAIQGCLKTKLGTNLSGYAVPVCVKTGTVSQTQRLTYAVDVYSNSDYRHEQPSHQYRTIDTCK